MSPLLPLDVPQREKNHGTSLISLLLLREKCDCRERMCSVTRFSEDFSFILGLSFDSFGFMFVVGNFVLFFLQTKALS